MVEILPRPEPAPDLKPIQDKVDALAGLVAAALPLVEKMDTLRERVGGIGKQIESLDADVLALKEGIAMIARKPAR
jgi:hypothetical protein